MHDSITVVNTVCNYLGVTCKVSL